MVLSIGKSHHLIDEAINKDEFLYETEAHPFYKSTLFLKY